MKKTFSTIIIIALTNFCYSQNKTYIGLEGAIANDFLEIFDPGNLVIKTPLLSPRLGLIIKQDINSYLSFESGFSSKKYVTGINYILYQGYGTSRALGSIFIPLRLITKINLYRQKIIFSPILGISYCINTEDKQAVSGQNYHKRETPTDTLIYSSYTQWGLTRSFALIQTGLSFEFIVKKTLSISIFSNYMSGLTKLYTTNFTYKLNSNNFVNGQAVSKGTYWDIGLSIKYPIRDVRTKE